MPLTSRYSSSQISPCIGLGGRECDEPGFMPLVVYTWLATLMRNRDRSDNVMIFDSNVHMAAKMVALDDPPQVCSLHLTKQKRWDWARRYHHELTQPVQAGVDQTSLAQCELWIQFGLPMWVEYENVGYARLEVWTEEEASQCAHAEVADEDLGDPEDDDEDPVLTGFDQRSPRKSTQVRAFQAGDADEEEPEASQAPKPKRLKTKAAAETKQTTLTQPQVVKRTLSLPDPGTAVGSTSRNKMLAAALNKKKKP